MAHYIVQNAVTHLTTINISTLFRFVLLNSTWPHLVNILISLVSDIKEDIGLLRTISYLWFFRPKSTRKLENSGSNMRLLLLVLVKTLWNMQSSTLTLRSN